MLESKRLTTAAVTGLALLAGAGAALAAFHDSGKLGLMFKYSALAMVTERIGLVATASTTFERAVR